MSLVARLNLPPPATVISVRSVLARWWWLLATVALVLVVVLVWALGGLRAGEPYQGRDTERGAEILTNHWSVKVRNAVIASVKASSTQTEIRGDEAVLAVLLTLTNRTDAPRGFAYGEVPVTVVLPGGDALTDATCRRVPDGTPRGGPGISEDVVCYYSYRLSGVDQPERGDAQVTVLVHDDEDADGFRDARAQVRGEVVAHVGLTAKDVRR